MNLNQVSVPAPDLEAAIAFYRLLGPGSTRHGVYRKGCAQLLKTWGGGIRYGLTLSGTAPIGDKDN